MDFFFFWPSLLFGCTREEVGRISIVHGRSVRGNMGCGGKVAEAGAIPDLEMRSSEANGLKRRKHLGESPSQKM